MGLFSSNNNDDLKVGDWVNVLTLGCGGTIVNIIGDDIYVDIGEHDDQIFRRSELKKY